MSRPSAFSKPHAAQPGKRTVVVGLGKTGLSCARFLAARGVPVAVTDSRAHPPGLDTLRDELPDVAVFMGGFNADALAHAEQIVLSPGVSLREPAVAAALKRGVPVLGDIELFARQVRAPVIAVTGSNGKSTVTTLIGLMAERAGRAVRMGGNLGTPALDLVQDTEPDVYVLELSSFQLETTHSLNAAAAALLNVTPDHMDRYADFDDYTRAKRRVFNGDGVMVINRDDARVAAMAVRGRRILRFGLDAPATPDDFGLRDKNGAPWLAHGDECLLPLSELRIQGAHNAANALAALALGAAMQWPRAPMLEVLREFPGLPHRSEWVAERDGVTWYNDSKGTNVGATLAALQGLAATPVKGEELGVRSNTSPLTPHPSPDKGSGKIVLIAGGDGKGADFTPLRAAVAAHTRAVVLIGRDAPLIAAALGDAAPTLRATDMSDAVRLARELAQAGDKVLL
ncbi:MAG: UDP-N-acetylmuramoyl-L-alanine--D-glutamate ligase, partial [Pseudomonadota bacterium]